MGLHSHSATLLITSCDIQWLDICAATGWHLSDGFPCHLSVSEEKMVADFWCKIFWLVVWTTLKNISQLGWLFSIYGKIKIVPNHQPVSIPLTGNLRGRVGPHWKPVLRLHPSRRVAASAFWARACPDACYPQRTSLHVWSRNPLEAKAGKRQTSGPGRNHARSTDFPWPSATQHVWAAEPPAATSHVVPARPTLVVLAR